MKKLAAYRTFIVGVLSPLMAAALGIGTYANLTRASADTDSDYFFRLTATAVAMVLPFLLTVFLALGDRRRGGLTRSAKLGLVFAVLSASLAWFPVQGLFDRARQAENLSLSGVEAPLFDTVDIDGVRYRLAEHKGKVVLVNIWATWCGPCRREMPELERLYQRRKEDGLMIFGVSTEDVATQRKFAETVVVNYPLLTTEGDVPAIYRQAARYPANFLIDRNGRLNPAPSAERPFEELEAAVDALLRDGIEIN